MSSPLFSPGLGIRKNLGEIKRDMQERENLRVAQKTIAGLSQQTAQIDQAAAENAGILKDLSMRAKVNPEGADFQALQLAQMKAIDSAVGAIKQKNDLYMNVLGSAPDNPVIQEEVGRLAQENMSAFEQMSATMQQANQASEDLDRTMPSRGPIDPQDVAGMSPEEETQLRQESPRAFTGQGGARGPVDPQDFEYSTGGMDPGGERGQPSGRRLRPGEGRVTVSGPRGTRVIETRGLGGQDNREGLQQEARTTPDHKALRTILEDPRGLSDGDKKYYSTMAEAIDQVTPAYDEGETNLIKDLTYSAIEGIRDGREELEEAVQSEFGDPKIVMRKVYHDIGGLLRHDQLEMLGDYIDGIDPGDISEEAEEIRSRRVPPRGKDQ